MTEQEILLSMLLSHGVKISFAQGDFITLENGQKIYAYEDCLFPMSQRGRIFYTYDGPHGVGNAALEAVETAVRESNE